MDFVTISSAVRFRSASMSGTLFKRESFSYRAEVSGTSPRLLGK
jgi:hypothetical protein